MWIWGDDMLPETGSGEMFQYNHLISRGTRMIEECHASKLRGKTKVITNRDNTLQDLKKLFLEHLSYLNIEAAKTTVDGGLVGYITKYNTVYIMIVAI